MDSSTFLLTQSNQNRKGSVRCRMEKMMNQRWWLGSNGWCPNGKSAHVVRRVYRRQGWWWCRTVMSLWKVWFLRLQIEKKAKKNVSFDGAHLQADKKWFHLLSWRVCLITSTLQCGGEEAGTHLLKHTCGSWSWTSAFTCRPLGLRQWGQKSCLLNSFKGSPGTLSASGHESPCHTKKGHLCTDVSYTLTLLMQTPHRSSCNISSDSNRAWLALSQTFSETKQTTQQSDPSLSWKIAVVSVALGVVKLLLMKS